MKIFLEVIPHGFCDHLEWNLRISLHCIERLDYMHSEVTLISEILTISVRTSETSIIVCLLHMFPFNHHYNFLRHPREVE